MILRIFEIRAQEYWSFDKQEYLVLAEKSETKLEYENGEVLDMAGSTAEHNRICLNIANVFDEKLPKGCQSFGINVRVEATENNSYYYPDVLAVCGEIEYSPDSPISILNPSIIVEVLSAGNTYNNMQKKLDVYKGLDSVKDVLYVESDRYLVRVFSRVTANWEYFAYILEDTKNRYRARV